MLCGIRRPSGTNIVFRVNDPAMLRHVKLGDKITFEPDKINGQFTIMKLEKKR